MTRLEELQTRFAQLPQSYRVVMIPTELANGDISLFFEGTNQYGIRYTASRVITAEEDLASIDHLFEYPNTITPRSILPATDNLKHISFDREGHLIVEKSDSIERFKVNPSQREEVTTMLKTKLHKYFK